ncbi:PH domain-containing protein [Deinococcus sp.]|uniref:PH domain-containing protein n=1 Tax=Deinococcus sp. TaxID=47478 RepID=UPI003CC694BC
MSAPASASALSVPTAQTKRGVWRLLRLVFAASMIAIAVLLVLPPLLGYPRYEVRAGVLTVRSIATSRTVRAGTPMQQVSLPPLRRSVGTASEGLCVGRFQAADSQMYELYSDCSPQVLLFRVPGQRPLAITPGDPSGLLDTLKSGGTATYHLPRSFHVPPSSWLLALPLLLLALLTLLPPPTLRYSLTPGALLVRRRLGTDRLPYAGMTVRPARGRLGLRLMGTGLPGYHTGMYASADGQVLADATSASAPALLIVSGGATYYLTPADPAGLMLELEKRGATLLP